MESDPEQVLKRLVTDVKQLKKDISSLEDKVKRRITKQTVKKKLEDMEDKITESKGAPDSLKARFDRLEEKVKTIDKTQDHLIEVSDDLEFRDQ